jgi:hypothetical protein
MTLITVAACPDYVVQVSDRRLTLGDGSTYTDEEGKSLYLELPGARFLVGYTGLARIRDQPMSQRLMEIFMEVGPAAEFQPLDIMERTTEALTELFQRGWPRLLHARDRRLTVMITGYVERDQGPHSLVQGLVTNFQDWGAGDSALASDAFVFTPFSTKPESEWPTLLQRIGQYDAWPLELMETKLRPLLEQRRPPQALRDLILSLLPEQSAVRPTIGAQANAAILRPGRQAAWTYHSQTLSWVSYSGDTVIVAPDNTIAMHGLQIEQVGAKGRPMHVPAVARHRPCPCGSGLRYRQCHGKSVT